MDKAYFLKNALVPAIAGIAVDTKPLWGKMNLQQMTEHLEREGFKVASGKTRLQLVTPEENVPAMQAFLMSEKEFRENTPNALMSLEPVPALYADISLSLAALQEEIDYFFAVFEQDPATVFVNPFFGSLNYEQQIRLLFKHARHHLKQFGITTDLL